MTTLRAAAEVCRIYQDWVRRNPQTTTEIESSIKFISYILAGKVSDSPILSELVYSVSNLWVLFNDKIILNAHSKFNNLPSLPPYPINAIKTWLTVLEYSEVFLEISARRLWGQRVKWIIITMVQLLKFMLRVTLLLKFKVNIIPTPAITPLDRRKLQKEEHATIVNGNIPSGFTLKSGRTIRTVNSASSSMRSWKPPEIATTSSQLTEIELRERILNSKQRIGEILYIAKPLVHLGLMYAQGPKSWPPWIMSLLMDVSSLGLLESVGDNATVKAKPLWNRQQQLEVQRRKLMLLLYLLKSPFYDKLTKRRLNKLLLVLSDSIPLVGMILRPVASYLPYWQDTHLYLWSS